MKANFKTEEQIEYLFRHGVDSTIVKYLNGIVPFSNHAIELFRGGNPVRHRRSTGWCLRGKESAITADRLLRLYLKMFPDNLHYCVRQLSISGLYQISFVYKNYYPLDDMSPNRIYYFIDALKVGSLVAQEACSVCKLPFVIATSGTAISWLHKNCSICESNSLSSRKDVSKFLSAK